MRRHGRLTIDDSPRAAVTARRAPEEGSTMAHDETNTSEHGGNASTTAEPTAGSDPLASAEQDAEREAAAITAEGSATAKDADDGPKVSRAKARTVNAARSAAATPRVAARSAGARSTA